MNPEHLSLLKADILDFLHTPSQARLPSQPLMNVYRHATESILCQWCGVPAAQQKPEMTQPGWQNKAQKIVGTDLLDMYTVYAITACTREQER